MIKTETIKQTTVFTAMADIQGHTFEVTCVPVDEFIDVTIEDPLAQIIDADEVIEQLREEFISWYENRTKLLTLKK